MLFISNFCIELFCRDENSYYFQNPPKIKFSSKLKTTPEIPSPPNPSSLMKPLIKRQVDIDGIFKYRQFIKNKDQVYRLKINYNDGKVQHVQKKLDKIILKFLFKVRNFQALDLHQGLVGFDLIPQKKNYSNCKTSFQDPSIVTSFHQIKKSNFSSYSSTIYLVA